MNDEYLNYMYFLETTLASFYERIKDEDRYSFARMALEFMEEHSFAHAELIEETMKMHPLPVLPEKLIVDYQNSVARDLYKKISRDAPGGSLYTSLAKSEEELGDLYLKISAHLKELAGHYSKMAGIIESIAADEYNHRDILLNDYEKLKKR